MSNLTPLQEIKLQFKQLTELPVPVTSEEFILGKSPDGVIRCFSPIFKKGIPTFDFKLEDDDWTYAHVKVTAAETPQFKVGDRVKWKDYNSEIVAINTNASKAAIQYETPIFAMGYIGDKTNTAFVLLTNLTLITNE